jgi:AraC-like DNA-binding protein
MTKSASASTDLVRVLVKYAERLGIDLDGLWQAAGLDPELDPDKARIPIEQFNALWQEITARANDPDIGLHFAEASAGLPGSNLLLAVMMNSPTLGAAMEKLCRYHSLSTDWVRLRLVVEGECAFYAWEPIYTDIPRQRQHSEVVLCQLALMLRRLSQGQVGLVEVHFSHPRPAGTREHERLFQCPVLFHQPQDELVLLREDLARPIFLANRALLDTLERFAEERLCQLAPPESWSERVTYQIGQVLLHGDRPALDEIAAALAISPRHLQNKLREEGTTYRALLDGLRHDMAVEYLGKPEPPIVDVAFLLGFSEQSAFNHAFKRWTGISPQEYRVRMKPHLA